MKLLALIEGLDHVCYRYRLQAMADEFARQGLHLEARPFGRGLTRIADLLAARHADIVVLQRKLLQRWQLAILRQSAKYLVYDIDDALFRRDSFAKKSQQSSVRLGRFCATVRAADAVLAGNEYLAHFAAAYTRPEKVHHVPTCVETAWYSRAKHCGNAARVNLVWIGQSSTLPSLTAAGAPLGEIGHRVPGAVLRVVCDALPPDVGMPTELRPWSSAAEADELAAADIGISWLCDDLWSLGKCGLKVLQYMAAGLPVVANAVGIHREFVRHGETGFLADTPQQWADAVGRLAVDPTLRSRMGAAARRRVEEEYSLRRWAPRVATILRELADPQGPPVARIFAEDTAETANA